MLKNRDLLQQVVLANGLDNRTRQWIFEFSSPPAGKSRASRASRGDADPAAQGYHPIEEQPG